MATATLAPAPAPRPQTRITVEEYYRLMETGVVPEDGRQELIHGIIVARPTINPPHACTLRNLYPLLFQLLGTEYVLCNQTPITLPPDSEPIPDFVIANGPKEMYYTRHPGPSDIKIVIEVADTSSASDRTKKLQYYSEAMLPEYWIVNIPKLRVEVYTEPSFAGDFYVYRTRKDCAIDDSVQVIIDGATIGSISVREILPSITR